MFEAGQDLCTVLLGNINFLTYSASCRGRNWQNPVLEFLGQPDTWSDIPFM